MLETPAWSCTIMTERVMPSVCGQPAEWPDTSSKMCCKINGPTIEVASLIFEALTRRGTAAWRRRPFPAT